MTRLILLPVFLLAVAACEIEVSGQEDATETADEFVARLNAEYEELAREVQAASWVRRTYITEDTALLNTLADQRFTEWQSRSVAESLSYDGQELSPDTARALNLLKFGTEAPAPA